VNPIKVIPLFMLGAVSVTGCFSPEDRFDDFVKQRRALLDDAGLGGETGGGGNGEPPRPEQLEGTYLYAVSVAIARTSPTVYLAEITARQVGDKLEVTIRQQPLSKNDWKTPVGPSSQPRTDLVSRSGEYTTELVVSTVPKEANAVTGAESMTEVYFTGTFENPATPDDPDAKVQFFCGTMTGMATFPAVINLAGSTFAATRIDTPDDPGSYPPVVIDCAMNPARALK